jgi:hypothetical protein
MTCVYRVSSRKAGMLAVFLFTDVAQVETYRTARYAEVGPDSWMGHLPSWVQATLLHVIDEVLNQQQFWAAQPAH